MWGILFSGDPESVGPRSLRIWAPGAARRSWASIGPTYGFAFRPNQCWALGAWSCREGVSHAGSHAGHCAVAQHSRRWLVGYLRARTSAPDTDASCCAAWGRSELQPFLRSAHWRCLRRCTREASYRTRCAISARADQHAIGTRGRVRISLWVQMQFVPGHTMLTMSVARARVAQQHAQHDRARSA